MVGARVTEVRIQNIDRPVGASNYGLGRTFGVALDILYLYFARYYFTRPLRAFGKLALLLLTLGASISGWLLVTSMITGEPTVRLHSGWFVLSALLMLASLQVLLVGILAEVLVRIYYRTGGAESYFVRQEWNASTLSVRRSWQASVCGIRPLQVGAGASRSVLPGAAELSGPS